LRFGHGNYLYCFQFSTTSTDKWPQNGTRPIEDPACGEESSFSGPEKYIKHIIFCQEQMNPEQAVVHTSYSII
jgi:hypothetical protein